MKKLLLITLLLIVGCSKEPINYETTLIERDGVFYTNDTNEPYSGPVFSLYDDGKKKEEGTYKDGKEDGLWSYWYENGKKEQEGTFKDGEKDGKWTYRYPPVEIYGHPDELVITKEEGNYKDDEKDGKWTFWNYKGEKKGEGTFKDGKVDGNWIWYYENEQKILELTFKDGLENGLWTQWYSNGKKRYEGNIKGEEGFRTEWYKNGQKKSEEKNVKIFPNYPFFFSSSLKLGGQSVIWSYSNRTIDRLYTEWYENGQKKEDWDINDGDGKVTYWSFDGKESWEMIYKDGEKWEGKLIVWYENGQKKYELTYKDGKQDGLWTDWYENGQKESELTYKDGKGDGLSTYWYENGQKEKEITYKDEELFLKKEWNKDGSVKLLKRVLDENGLRELF